MNAIDKLKAVIRASRVAYQEKSAEKALEEIREIVNQPDEKKSRRQRGGLDRSEKGGLDRSAE